jgi:hypothetical protein
MRWLQRLLGIEADETRLTGGTHAAAVASYIDELIRAGTFVLYKS